jgi:Holliday junction resolvase RusA-like endonuclease
METGHYWGSSTMKIVIPGDPLPFMRVIPCRRNGKSFAIDPRAADKQRTRWLIKRELQVLNDKEAIKLDQGAAYDVELIYHMPIPFSRSLKSKKACSWGIEPHDTKPDIDNLTKYILDSGNGLLWPDDRCIVSLSAKKIYSENPRTEISIMVKQMLTIDDKTRKVFDIFGPKDIQALSINAMKLAQFSAENVEELAPADKEIWMRSMADILIEFSKRYSKPLAQLAKITEDKRHGKNQKIP